MRLIVCIEKEGIGNQILTDAAGIPNLDDIVVFSKNKKYIKYYVTKREWFMTGDDFEKSLEINMITISKKCRQIETKICKQKIK